MCSNVYYHTNNCIFIIDKVEMVNQLKKFARESNYQEEINLLNYISFQQSSGDIVLPEHSNVEYFILCLIDENKGSVFCKECEINFGFEQLLPIKIGLGDSLFQFELSIKEALKNLLFRKKKLFDQIGGKGYQCPNGHYLIGKITWST